MILIFKYIVPRGYTSITLFPFVFLKNRNLKFNSILINHEKIHLRQQLELLILPFYIWYTIEFIIKLIYFKKWNEAYKNISFEKEAYKNEKDLDYIKSRSFWNFISYL